LLADLAERSRTHLAGGEQRRAFMALFSGERGTGKTMAAQALGNDLRVPVIEVDAVAASTEGVAVLAATIWRALHDGAPHRAVVVFDDAGALLGPGPAHRAGETDVIDLTARCADYPGIIIFCSRIAVRLTPAEQERVSAIVPFPMPEAPARVHLWRQSLPAEAAVSEADVEFLARSFRLSGGAIHACCTTAQRAAEKGGRRVSRSDLATALELEYSNWVLGPATRAALETLRVDHAPHASDRTAADASAGVPPEARRGPSLPWRRRDRG
jgi:AAA+ superfamily predicted ATPase